MSVLYFFTTNSFIGVQSWNGNDHIHISDPTYSVLISNWFHIVQTWSSTNSLHFYINNILVASLISSATTYIASSALNYITLANIINGMNVCIVQGISNVLHKGDIDDLGVYSRQLSPNHIYSLYNN